MKENLWVKGSNDLNHKVLIKPHTMKNTTRFLSVLHIVAGILLIPVTSMAQDDPFLWLEEVEGEKSLEWVKDQNSKTLAYFADIPEYEQTLSEAYDILTDEKKLVYPEIHQDDVYNFWQDANHSRGILRKQPVNSYVAGKSDWEVVLDIDKLTEESGIPWVYKYVDFAGPESNRCILILSEGGTDASHLREFDIAEKRFVKDGFNVPSAKSNFEWINENEIYIATDFGEGSLTKSGYPRIIKRWERGTPLSEAELVFEASEEDMIVAASVLHDKDNIYEFIHRYIDFYNQEVFLLLDNELRKLPLPDDFDFTILDGNMVLHLLSDWTIGKATFKSGDVVSVPVQDLLTDSPSVEYLFQAGDRVSVESVGRAGDRIYMLTLNNIKSELSFFNHADGQWNSKKAELPAQGAISMIFSSPFQPLYAVTYSSFNQPATLYLGNSTQTVPSEVMRQTDYFDASGILVDQYEVTSADGTKIPYFINRPKDMEFNGNNPVMILGYGGFNISETPYYSATIGKFWLEKGGVFVLANIRGGGEFGPSWHEAAIKENKQKSYDDFIAVAEDLIDRKITSPEHLGIYGGSNGGLLVGAVMVQRPDLYGAVACFVPLLDMKRYSHLLSGNSWIAEYGDPDKPEEWAYISKYSPYQNVKAGEYPAVLFLTSTRDDRVHPGHARKMTAKMLDQGHDVMLFENTEGGHGASYTPEETARTIAMYYSFFRKELF